AFPQVDAVPVGRLAAEKPRNGIVAHRHAAGFGSVNAEEIPHEAVSLDQGVRRPRDPDRAMLLHIAHADITELQSGNLHAVGPDIQDGGPAAGVQYRETLAAYGHGLAHDQAGLRIGTGGDQNHVSAVGSFEGRSQGGELAAFPHAQHPVGGGYRDGQDERGEESDQEHVARSARFMEDRDYYSETSASQVNTSPSSLSWKSRAESACANPARFPPMGLGMRPPFRKVASWAGEGSASGRLQSET